MDKDRQRMVEEIKTRYGFDDSKVLDAMLQVPRHEFVPNKYPKNAYEDTPIDIGYGQTISQPYTAAFMTKLVTSEKDKVQSANKKTKVLEIGTGSGYQAAVLSHFFDKVYTVEIIPELAEHSRTVLARLKYKSVFVKTGSGEWGWKEHALYDAIMVTAGMEKVPHELLDQLKVGGILVAPVGEGKEKVMTRIIKLRGLVYSDLKKPTSLKLRGAWEEFGTFSFVPFVRNKL